MLEYDLNMVNEARFYASNLPELLQLYRLVNVNGIQCYRGVTICEQNI